MFRKWFAASLTVAGVFLGAADAQETANWPGFGVDYREWAGCHYPWTDPGPMSCVLPTGGAPAGYIPFLAQIFVDLPEESFLPEVREGKALYEMQHVCGGALVAPDWVITAAHCISKKNISQNYKVRLGVDRISDRRAGVVFDIVDVVRHPDFVNFRRDDIALVKIAPKPSTRVENPEFRQPIERATRIGDNVLVQDADGELGEAVPGQWADANGDSYVKFINFAKPFATPVSRVPWGLEEVDVYGWGKTEDVAGDAPAPDTYKVTLTVMPNEFCARLDGFDPEKFPSSVFCAMHPDRKTCRGDSGGPVVDALGNIIGIVSWGKNRCIGDGQPGVYTRVAAYSDWIDQVIGGSLKKRAAETDVMTSSGGIRQ